MTVIHDDDAVRRVPRSMRERHGVAFLVDQGAVGLASTWVPFFGRYAKTPRGPAVFALRLKTPLLFACALRQPSGRFVLHIRVDAVESTGIARCRRRPHRRLYTTSSSAGCDARPSSTSGITAAGSISVRARRRSWETPHERRVKRALRRDVRAWFGIGVVVRSCCSRCSRRSSRITIPLAIDL